MANAGTLAAVSGGIGAAKLIANSLTSLTNTSARLAAGHYANAVSRGAQDRQAAFNKNQAELANNINRDTLAGQYGFNSGQAAVANNFTSDMWNKAASYNMDAWNMAAEWNERMLNRQMDFNAAEAQKNRDWQKMMSDTQYQRAIKDLRAAGLNPILAATGGLSAGIGSGSAASVGGASLSPASMSGASGAMASGGLLGADSANISNYTGQLEYMGGIMGILGQAFNGMSSAVQALTKMPFDGQDVAEIIRSILGETHGGENPTVLGIPLKDPEPNNKKGKVKYTNRGIFRSDGLR